MIDVLTLICTICSISIIIFGVFVLIKNENASRNYDIILDSICRYRTEQIINNKECLVDYSDMLDYNTVAFRVFDWGYKHILPNDKFAIIEPYIKENI